MLGEDFHFHGLFALLKNGSVEVSIWVCIACELFSNKEYEFVLDG
jgi:hypothetical protein